YPVDAIPDGASNTVAIAERLMQCNGTQTNANNYRYTGVHIVTVSGLGSIPGTGQNTPLFNTVGGTAKLWGTSNNGAVNMLTPYYYTPKPQIGVTNKTCLWDTDTQGMETKTAHPSAMLCGMADGGVRSVGPNVTDVTWYRVCQPIDHQMLD